MTNHLILLRGINVSGHNMIKMEALKSLLENIGFLNVETYSQSGNIFVETVEENPAKVGFIIKQEIFKILGLDVPLVKNTVDFKKLYVAFVSKELSNYALDELKISQFKPDEASIDKSRIYIKYDVGAGKTRLDQKYIEKKLNVIAAIRNWTTITVLLEKYQNK